MMGGVVGITGLGSEGDKKGTVDSDMISNSMCRKCIQHALLVD